MERLSQAADALCEADMTDNMIRRSQDWKLLSMQAAHCATVGEGCRRARLRGCVLARLRAARLPPAVRRGARAAPWARVLEADS